MAAPSDTADESSARDRILLCAVTEFARRGFDGATTVEIARRAGVAQALVPYHFGTKRVLFDAAVSHMLALLAAEFDEIDRDMRDLDVADRTKVLIRRFVRFSARHPEFTQLVGRLDERADALTPDPPAPLAELTHSLTALAAQGRLRPGVDVAHLVYCITSAASGIFVQARMASRFHGLDVADPAVVEAHADTVIQLVFGGIQDD